MSTIDRAAQAFGLTLAVLAGELVDMARRVGFVLDDATFDALPAATRDDVEVGTLVAVWAHQRIRVARVWEVKGSKLSAVYVTPTEVERAARFGCAIVPNNITAKITGCALVSPAPAAAQPAVEVAPVVEPAGGIASQPAEISVGEVTVDGMLPLAGGDGFLF